MIEDIQIGSMTGLVVMASIKIGEGEGKAAGVGVGVGVEVNIGGREVGREAWKEVGDADIGTETVIVIVTVIVTVIATVRDLGIEIDQEEVGATIEKEGIAALGTDREISLGIDQDPGQGLIVQGVITAVAINWIRWKEEKLLRMDMGTYMEMQIMVTMLMLMIVTRVLSTLQMIPK